MIDRLIALKATTNAWVRLIREYVWDEANGYEIKFDCAAAEWNVQRNFPDQILFSSLGKLVKRQDDFFGTEEIKAKSSQLRSPLVLECIDDYLSGKKIPLSHLKSNL